MKILKQSLLLLMALAALGCSKMKDPERQPSRDLKVTLTAEAYKTAGGLKTPVWTDSEDVSMYDGIERRRFIKPASAGSASAEFSMPLNRSASFFYAVRAREAYLVNLEDESFKLRTVTNCGFSNVQSGEFNDAAVGVALCKDLGTSEVEVRNFLGGVEFTVESPDVQYAEFSSVDNAYVAGYVSIDLSGDEPVASLTMDKAYKTITAGPLTSNSCYITMVPAVFAKGIRIRLLDAQKREVYAQYYEDGAIEVKRSEFYDLGQVDKYRYNYFSGGDGSEANPYQIATAQEFKNLTTLTNDATLYKDYVDKHYILTKDIDCRRAGVLEPVSRNYPFTGSFDGASYKLDNFTCSSSTGKPSGLFGQVGGDAVIRNVYLASATIYSDGADVGGIAGQMTGGMITGCTVDAASVISSAQDNAGGIAGYVKSESAVTIEKCAFHGQLSAAYNLGGIAGYTYSNPTDITIHACSCSGASVLATSYKDDSNCFVGLGGIAGYAYPYTGGLLTIEGCCCVGSTLASTATSGANGAVGGIFGCTYGTKNSCIVHNCYAKAAVSSSTETPNVGAIFGVIKWGSTTNNTKVTYCYYPSTDSIGDNSGGKGVLSDNEALPDAAFTDGTLLGKLQSSASGTEWETGVDGMPAIKGLK